MTRPTSGAIAARLFTIEPSRPFRTASLKHVKPLTDLGLYSITFTNDIDADHASLEAFRDFRADAEANGFSYFLEVFNPNVERGLNARRRCLSSSTTRSSAASPASPRPSGRTSSRSPITGREPWKSWRPSIRIWWSACWAAARAPTRDCFELIHQAEKYGARVALFGRKINLAELPLDIVRLMRAVADGALDSARGGQGLSRGA